jgi:tyrosyl-tRNA synthetase
LFKPVKEQLEIIRRGISEIIPEDELVKKLEKSYATNTPLRVKLGCDPSRPDLHLGHSVVLRKLRAFQDLGHIAVLIIGDFTGMIGDPSGRSKTRPPLTIEETRVNGKTYFEQATRILATKDLKMLYNSDWLGKMNFSEVIKLAAKYTVARMLERDDFTNRYKAGEPIGIHEMMYPLAQAMDSVAIDADIELGGTDQKFNLLVGREIQREFGKAPQVIMTLPILTGIDGVDKMSKSLNNYIAINDTPREMYGKTLKVPDQLIYQYFELTTSISLQDLKEIKTQLEISKVNPRDIKRRLARMLVAMYYDEKTAKQAEEEFDRIFIDKEIPDEIDEYRLKPTAGSKTLTVLIAEAKLASSKGEARRLIEQGGVSIDGEKVSDVNAIVPASSEFILKVGKRKFLKVIQ